MDTSVLYDDCVCLRGRFFASLRFHHLLATEILERRSIFPKKTEADKDHCDEKQAGRQDGNDDDDDDDKQR